MVSLIAHHFNSITELKLTGTVAFMQSQDVSLSMCRAGVQRGAEGNFSLEP